MLTFKFPHCDSGRTRGTGDDSTLLTTLGSQTAHTRVEIRYLSSSLLSSSCHLFPVMDNSSAISIKLVSVEDCHQSAVNCTAIAWNVYDFSTVSKLPEGQTSSNGLTQRIRSLSFSSLSKLSTSQVVVQILDQQENEGVGQFILCWEEVVTLLFSRVADHHRGGGILAL